MADGGPRLASAAAKHTHEPTGRQYLDTAGSLKQTSRTHVTQTQDIWKIYGVYVRLTSGLM